MPLSASDARVADRLCRAIPAASVIGAMLMMAVPLPLGVGAMPNLALLMVIIWTILQPRLMPAWASFLCGLLFDLVSGQPLGHSALLFALTGVAVGAANRHVEANSFGFDWAFTTLLLMVEALLSWQICAFAGQPTALWPLLLQGVTTALAYPPAVAVAAAIQRRIVVWAA
jgi:rod shape-determining protein MreD